MGVGWWITFFGDNIYWLVLETNCRSKQTFQDIIQLFLRALVTRFNGAVHLSLELADITRFETLNLLLQSLEHKFNELKCRLIILEL